MKIAYIGPDKGAGLQTPNSKISFHGRVKLLFDLQESHISVMHFAKKVIPIPIPGIQPSHVKLLKIITIKLMLMYDTILSWRRFFV